MRTAFFATFLSILHLIAAQDSNCAAEPVVTVCLASTGLAVTACGASDFACLCSAYQSVATCYNNCPDDARAPSANALVTQNCALASQYVSTKTANAVGTDHVATAVVEATATVAVAANTTATHNAGTRFEPLVGAIVVVAGLIGAAL
jgi:hypothetical protein